MKKTLFLISLISTLNLAAQNVFNTSGDAFLDGRSLTIERPITSGGWARGIFFQQRDSEVKLGGLGMLGTSSAPYHLYMAHGESPWASNLGLYVRPNGFTGIGTTNPSQKLEVSNGNLLVQNGNIYIKGAANDAGDLIFQKGTSGQLGRIWTQTSGDSGLFLSSGDNAPDLTINNTGNVGIGLTNPTTKLGVNGSVSINHAASNYSYLQMGHDTHDRIFVDNNSDRYYGGGIFFRVTSHPDLEIPYNYIDVMTLSDKGNVGIGTRDTKGFKLGVNGKIAATEVKVAQYANWPDFVFYDDYKLPTLQEVETHIKEKGHLKDIPSAKEVEENGIFLGDMNAKLLQKIEELTLYTIEQQKEITELKLLNKKLLELQLRLEKLEH